jgi:hypothetical protein
MAVSFRYLRDAGSWNKTSRSCSPALVEQLAHEQVRLRIPPLWVQLMDPEQSVGAGSRRWLTWRRDYITGGDKEAFIAGYLSRVRAHRGGTLARSTFRKALRWPCHPRVQAVFLYILGMRYYGEKLTVTVDAEVYNGLHSVIGRRRISRFLNDLARPYVVGQDLARGYTDMAADEAREREADA